ncbi:uncharacterized protein LOC112568566 [Pomacea canaliculata]|uniref:uncharacterized protein LOC112568566 n=1 Tax=Pomacea canaliculata TaxID=400727 RepID=UPI000D73371A|nr:uncharacterized protein LOC112568566 [Pomacea canaliculata]
MALIGHLRDEKSLAPYTTQVQALCEWFKSSYLELNVGKTKELVIDQRKGKEMSTPLVIGNEEVERVTTFKYLGTVIDDSLNFTEHVGTVHKKAQQRLYLIRKLRSFNVSEHILVDVYRALVESVITFNIVSWYGQTSVTTKNKLRRVINTASRIVGSQQLSLSHLYDSALVRKATQIMLDPTHPLNPRFEPMPSGRRLRVPLVKKNVYRRSFIPSAISAVNKQKTISD